MTGLTLHHYGLSPFGETMRLAFGCKVIVVHAVEVPA